MPAGQDLDLDLDLDLNQSAEGAPGVGVQSKECDGFRLLHLDAHAAVQLQCASSARAYGAAGALQLLPTVQHLLYGHPVLTIASRLGVMNRLGRAMADPTRSRILMALLEGPSYPAVLSSTLGLTRSNVSNHLACLRDCGIAVAEPEGRQTRYEIADPHLGAALVALVDVTLAVDERASCLDPACSIDGCCGPSGVVA